MLCCIIDLSIEQDELKMSKIIIVCNGFNSHFFQEISFYYRELTLQRLKHVGFLTT